MASSMAGSMVRCLTCSASATRLVPDKMVAPSMALAASCSDWKMVLLGKAGLPHNVSQQFGRGAAPAVAEHTGDAAEGRQRHAVAAVLIFLHLLECDASSIAQRRL